MAGGEKSPESFASLYLGGTRPGAGKRPVQSDLFAPPPVSTKTKNSVSIGSAAAQVSEAGAAGRVPGAPAEGASAGEAERLWTVRGLVGAIRREVEGQHLRVWVEGEISNCREAGSGHVYFTLKDGEAQLPGVLFRREAGLMGVKLKDGDAVEVRGRVSVYEPRGQLQLIAERVELRGAGALEQAFLRLKVKLKAEGLFEAERKRLLPAFPKCLGVVSSPGGAVIRDIVQVGRRRHAAMNLLLYPAVMQGPGCPAQVAAGIRWFNRQAAGSPGAVEVIILARGGGSAEDLAGFNDERVARAIAGSAIPVVSAIGHETDFTIADFVADVRAATPSAAAELVTAAQHRVEERVELLGRRVRRAMEFQMLRARGRFARLSAAAVLVRMRDAVGRREQRVDELRFRMEAAAGRRLRSAGARAAGMEERLRRQDPAARLERAGARLARAAEGMERARAGILAGRRERVERAAGRLEALSPVAVLRRGYALVYGEDGRLLRSSVEVTVGERVRARLGDGALVARVEGVG